MTLLTIGFIGLGAVLTLIALRVPIGVVLLLVSFCGVWFGLSFNVAWGLARAVPFDIIANWSFSAVPMFLFMGYIAGNSGLTTGMFGAMNILLRRLPGGLACSGVAACGLFAAANGSSIATAGAMARIAVPEMLKAGYDKGLAAGSIAAGGTLGSLIPPSLLMIVFAIFVQISVGDLFMAGVLPGILSMLVYIAMIMIRVKLKPSLAPVIDYEPTRADKIAALKDIWPLPTLILGVLGGIFAGVMTPTEAGAVGATIAIVIAAFYRTLSWQVIMQSVRDAAIGTSTVFVIVIGATMFTSFMGLSGVPRAISGVLTDLAGDRVLVLILVIAVVYLIMGMFIDSIGIMLLTLPIFMPLLQHHDVNMIWFGIIVIKLLEIGMITPPVGLNCFVIGSTLRGQVPLQTVFSGALWFVAADLFTLGLLIAFPAISLLLPSLR